MPCHPTRPITPLIPAKAGTHPNPPRPFRIPREGGGPRRPQGAHPLSLGERARVRACPRAPFVSPANAGTHPAVHKAAHPLSPGERARVRACLVTPCRPPSRHPIVIPPPHCHSERSRGI